MPTGAEGGMEVTEEDRKILEAFHAMKLKPPKIEKPEDLMSYMKHLGEEYNQDIEHDQDLGARPKTGSHHYPKLSTFYGEDNKGEVNWPTFKFEIDSLLQEKLFSQEQILLGLRRAVKGNASDVVRRLGTGVNIHDVIRKLQGTFGNVETQESIMEKFYSSHQKPKESVTSYASRLEEIFTQAVELGGMSKSDDQKLKSVLYRGLRHDIKQQSGYKYDTIMDYDRFKIELRKIEANLKEEEPENTKCHAAVNIEKNTNEELLKKLNKTEELLLKLNERIDKLEQRKDTSDSYRTFNQTPNYGYGRGYRGGYRGNGGRYNRGRSNGGARGRGEYKPQRPTGSGTFKPTCFKCQEKGHIAKNCPKA